MSTDEKKNTKIIADLEVGSPVVGRRRYTPFFVLVTAFEPQSPVFVTHYFTL